MKGIVNFRISGKTADVWPLGFAFVYLCLIKSSKSSLSDLVGLMAHRQLQEAKAIFLKV